MNTITVFNRKTTCGHYLISGTYKILHIYDELALAIVEKPHTNELFHIPLTIEDWRHLRLPEEENLVSKKLYEVKRRILTLERVDSATKLKLAQAIHEIELLLIK